MSPDGMAKYATALFVGIVLALAGGALYDAGVVAGRQSVEVVACTPFVDSVRVVPLVTPRGPVKGAPGRTP